MIKLLIGKKGTGKTKALIEQVNAASSVAKGNVVFISNNTSSAIFDISKKVRMTDTTDFDIANYSEFEGFICGIISGNYDITNIFVDGLFKIVNGDDLDGLENFLTRLEKISVKFDISFVLTLSIDADAAPDYVKNFA
ncbi:MAG: twitching motility protein PilT [Clostridia bacterium]|nr:twitching motility protein PilT [Clostridia bacterium]